MSDYDFDTLKRHGFPKIIDTGKYLQYFTTLESKKQRNLWNWRVLLFTSYRRRSGSLLVYFVLLKSYLRNPHQRNRVFLRCMKKIFSAIRFLIYDWVLGIVECWKKFFSARRWDHGSEALQAMDTWCDYDCSSLTCKNHIWSLTNQRQQRQHGSLYCCVVLGTNGACKETENFRYLFKLRIIFPNSYTPSKSLKLQEKTNLSIEVKYDKGKFNIKELI